MHYLSINTPCNYTISLAAGPAPARKTRGRHLTQTARSALHRTDRHTSEFASDPPPSEQKHFGTAPKGRFRIASDPKKARFEIAPKWHFEITVFYSCAKLH